MSDSEEPPYAVIDTGSQTLKVGLSGEDYARTLPTCIGRSKRDPSDDSDRIAPESWRQGTLNLTYPKADGTVNSWSDIEKIWSYCFNSELRVCTQVFDEDEADIAGVLLLDTPTSSRKDREQMAQIMFERFGVGEFFLGNDAVLPVFASGRTSALSVTSGHSVSLTVPVVDGFSLPFATRRCSTAGKQADEYMFMTLPDGSNIEICSSFDKKQAVECKHLVGTASMDFEVDSARLSAEGHPQQCPFTADAIMNGWNLSTVHHEAVGCAEIMFNPQQGQGIHQCAAASLLDADADIRQELLRNVVLSGGNTLFNNYSERMQKELHKITRTAPTYEAPPPIFPPSGGEPSEPTWNKDANGWNLMAPPEASACSPPKIHNEIRFTDAIIPDILRFNRFEM